MSDPNLLTEYSARTAEVLEAALQQGNVRIGVLQEMNTTREINTHYILGYRFWVTEAEIFHRCGTTIVW